MSVQLLTHRMIASIAADVLDEEMPFVSGANMNYDKEFAKNVGGFNLGQSVDIKIPPVPKVFDGPVLTTSGFTDEYQTLSLDKWKGIQLTVDRKDLTLEVADFKEQVMRPQISTMASTIEATLLQEACILSPHWVGTAGTVPTSLTTYQSARGKLQEELASTVDRRMIVTTAANNAIVDASRQLFNPNADIANQYREGYMGRALQADWFESQNLPVVTMGTQASFTVNGASQTGSSLNIGSITSGNTILRGTKFTIANHFATHPLTGAATTTLQQYTVTADFTASATTGTISIYPAIKPPSVDNTNVVASPANGAAATLYAGASAAVRQNLLFQKNAYAVAVVPMKALDTKVSYPVTLKNGIGVTYSSDGDIVNARNVTRLDCLFGIARPRSFSCAVLQ